MSHCLISHRIPGPCHTCRGPVEAAHIVSGDDGIAKILCQHCCPEHGVLRKRAASAGAAGEDLQERKQG